MLICMMVAYGVAQIFNQSLYNRALRGKQVPMLMNKVPRQNINLRASVIMKQDPVSLKVVTTVKDLQEALAHGYRQYPVMNNAGQMVGAISTNFLIILVENKNWYEKGGPVSEEDNLYKS